MHDDSLREAADLIMQLSESSRRDTLTLTYRIYLDYWYEHDITSMLRPDPKAREPTSFGGHLAGLSLNDPAQVLLELHSIAVYVLRAAQMDDSLPHWEGMLQRIPVFKKITNLSLEKLAVKFISRYTQTSRAIEDLDMAWGLLGLVDLLELSADPERKARYFYRLGTIDELKVKRGRGDDVETGRFRGIRNFRKGEMAIDNVEMKQRCRMKIFRLLSSSSLDEMPQNENVSHTHERREDILRRQSEAPIQFNSYSNPHEDCRPHF